MKKTLLKEINAEQLVILKRNPQYLTSKQMNNLKKSIERDGFCAPILVRQIKKERYEIVSGNHRFMASQELGIKKIPCVVAKITAKEAQRLAINLNTIHGNPNAELLAPFLAELDEDILKEIFIEDDMKKELLEFDEHLADMLAKMEPPEKMNRESPTMSNKICICPVCERKHFKNEKL
jgi:ParB/RepB/Spo0J family partition protein